MPSLSRRRQAAVPGVTPAAVAALLVALLLAALLAAPVALAGNAGTNQYVDPLGNTQPPPSGSGSGNAGGQGRAGTAQNVAGQGAVGGGGRKSGSLPYSGSDVWTPALAGLLCLGAAAGLRRVTRSRP